jgi:hypothetical protein
VRQPALGEGEKSTLLLDDRIGIFNAAATANGRTLLSFPTARDMPSRLGIWRQFVTMSKTSTYLFRSLVRNHQASEQQQSIRKEALTAAMVTAPRVAVRRAWRKAISTATIVGADNVQQFESNTARTMRISRCALLSD